MAAANPNVDLFDAYFRRADLNRDGRIDGNEAAAFFRGSNLSNQVLAKIWAFADKNRAGFLGREEFYNFLKLVTVAQSKRELIPDIVNAALYGPASSKIPAPQISFPTVPASQPNAGRATAPQMSVAAVGSPQNPAFRGPAVSVPNSDVTQLYSHSVNQSVRPPQAMPGAAARPMQGVATQGFSGGGTTVMPNLSNPEAGKANGTPAAGVMQASVRGSSPSIQAGIVSAVPGSMPPKPPVSSGIATSMYSSVDMKPPASQNGFATDSLLGRNAFAATSSQPKRDTTGPLPTTTDLMNSSAVGYNTGFSSSAGVVTNSSAPVPPSAGSQTLLKQASLGTIHNSLKVQPGRGNLQRPPIPKPNQQVSVHNAHGVPPQMSASSQSQPQWPRMTQSDIQKYTKVFVAVDTDKDGKITGEQARNLFLSWRLPREVLKQVWDLSDQDTDTMLSLREFCIALYLMERYREGRPLPPVLPSNIMNDLPAAVPPTGGYGNTAWGYSSGLQQQQSSSVSAARQTARPSGRPPLPVPAPNAEDRMHPKQQKAKVPELEKHLVDQLSEEEQKSLNSKFQEATEANKKVEELEKDIKESREKMEFYRVKMQELVLYKSRCDNHLNEITERASADKREVESLSKTYEEKYRQAGDVSSKLTIEEATFRDIQEKKMELYRAIVKLEQQGGNDESLKSRIESIRIDLEELVKSLNERCKKYGLRAKPTTLLELPFGWQPGVQEGSADWDEDWDKFEDEGFTFVKELTLEVQNIVPPPKTKVKPARKESGVVDDNESTGVSAEAEGNMKKSGSTGEQVAESEAKTKKAADVVERLDENGSAHDQTEDVFVKSPADSPSGKSKHASPLDDFRDDHVNKTATSDASSHDKELKSNHVEKNVDEPSWGTFDANDDVDSVWGFNQEAGRGKHTDDDLFGPGGLALNPIKTGSSFSGGNFVKKSSVFADSVPGTPLFNASYSPQKHGEGPEKHGFNFSRFDSFRSTESGFPQPEFSRFDSMRSTADFDAQDGNLRFPSFDESDSLGSAPFKTVFGSETPRSEFGGPFRSTFGSETPRSEFEGPFRSTFDSETPRSDFGEPFRSTFGSETPRSEFGGPYRSTFGSETPRSEFGGPFTSAFGSETPSADFSGPFRSTFESETPRSEYDAFGSSGPFKSFGSETPRRDSDPFGYRGSFKSSFGSETPRADADPFGSVGPFKSSLGDDTPRRESEPFGSSGPFKSSFTDETPRGGTRSWSAF